MKSQGKFTKISRKEAKSKGLAHYFTGKACKRGHVSPRNTRNCGCLICQKGYNTTESKEKQRVRYQENRVVILRKQKLRNLECKEEIREYQKNYREKTTEKRLQYHKEYYQQNKDEQIRKSKEHRENNKEYYEEYNKLYYQSNKEDLLEYGRKYNKIYYQENKEELSKKTLERYHSADDVQIEERKQRRRDYRESSHGASVLNACGAKRRCMKLNATPSWYEHDKCKKLYKKSQQLTEKTGIQHHVDHIIPLQNPLVCGLHCFDNLQVLTETENLKKGNSLLL